MSTATRTDVHAPSRINSEDYSFLTCIYIGSAELDPGEIMQNAENLQFLREYQLKTGAKYSNHDHGGTCHICGARALYLAVFVHNPTGDLIRCGEDCADKLFEGHPEAFRAARNAVRDARLCKAGKNRAAMFLADAGLSDSWKVHNTDRPEAADARTWNIHHDIVSKLIRYGSISEAQQAFLKRLTHEIMNAEEVRAQRTAERKAKHDAAEPCPAGRVRFTGRIVSAKRIQGEFGVQRKVLIETEQGWKAWGTLPQTAVDEIYSMRLFEQAGEDYYEDRIKIARGYEIHITLTAAVTPSNDDPKFGFYSRPTKTELRIVETE